MSIDPIFVNEMQITKSVYSVTGEKKSSDTMGTKNTVDFGIYVTYGSINCQLAEKTGFSDEDAEKIKQSLITLFENDCSSARPEGSMEVLKVIWWKHNCASGQYSSAKVHRSLVVRKKACVEIGSDIDDYEITVNELEGLTPEIIDGL